MLLTNYSFIMAVLWSSVFIVITYFIRKKYAFLPFFGIGWLAVFYLLCAARMLVPFEFPFTYEIQSWVIYAGIYYPAAQNFVQAGPLSLSIVDLCVLTGFAGTLFFLLRLLHGYRKACAEIRCYQKEEAYGDILKEIQKDTGKSISVAVRTSPDVHIPMGFGIRNRVILLPENNFDPQTLYFILLHEYTHFLNQDLLTKLLVHLFRCVFWWNPLAYLLQKDLAQTLEMKCDDAICKGLNKQEKAAYLQAIVSVLRHADSKKRPFIHAVAIAETTQEKSMKERFAYLLRSHGKNQHAGISLAALCTIVVCLFVLSYSFILQPAGEPPMEEIVTEEGVIEIPADEVMIIEKADGTFVLVDPYGEQEITKETTEAMLAGGTKYVKE